MRINCARCGKLHDSTMTPFKYNKVRNTPINTDGNKEVRSVFDCKHCGWTNFVAMTWYASAYGPNEVYEDSDYCKKCGSRFFTHNGDGSCVEEE